MGMNPRLLRPILSGDPDALRYIAAVQAADQQSLEPAVRKAFTDFIVGCKQDGIWSSIKASCILMGARTLAGALTPLVGPAPTNNGPFVSGDWDRETGLLGDGVGKYLDSGRNCNADPLNSYHQAVFISSSETPTSGAFIGAGGNATGASNFSYNAESTLLAWRNQTAFATAFLNQSAVNIVSLVGTSRDNASTYQARRSNSESTVSRFSQSPLFDGNVLVFAAADASNAASSFINARLRFYSMGEAVSLGDLRSRVSTLSDAIAAAI